MFKTPYKTIYRIHTIEEALEFNLPKDKTDMYLYLIDTYDVLLSAAIGSTPDIPKDKIQKCRKKIHAYFMDNFHSMYIPIPGRLYGWTHTMLIYVILLTLIEMEYTSEYPKIPEHIHKFCVENRIRMYKDRDTKTWKLHTYLDMMDVISFRWSKLTPCSELNELLEVIYRYSAKINLFMHGEELMNMEDYIEPVIINDEESDYVKATAQLVMAGMARYYWFHQMIKQWVQWKDASNEGIEYPNLETSNWLQFLEGEKKHMITRRFRDGVADFVWDRLINIGDHAIGAHDQLGDEVSNYGMLYVRFPAQLPTGLSRLCTYKEYEDIVQSSHLRDILHCKLVHAHFRAAYDIDFIKIFTVWDISMHAHFNAIDKCPVPLIFVRFKRYHCYYNGEIYKHPDGHTFPHAFITWCYILRKFCDCACFNSMDFTPTVEALLDKKEVVNNTRDLGAFFDLTDD